MDGESGFVERIGVPLESAMCSFCDLLVSEEAIIFANTCLRRRVSQSARRATLPSSTSTVARLQVFGAAPGIYIYTAVA
jgi:hypothetical protein